MRASLTALLALALAATASAFDVTGRVLPNTMLNSNNMPIDARIDVDFGKSSARIRRDGSFVIPLESGRHVLRPFVAGMAMPDFVITVPNEDEPQEPKEGEEATPTPQVHVQGYMPGRALASGAASLPYPLEFQALARMNYYTPAAGVNVLQMLKSPMVLMMLASAFMAIVLPKLSATLESDPEVAAEMKQHREKMSKTMQMDWSGALAGRLAAAGGEPQSGSATPPDSAAGVDGGAGSTPRQAARGGKRGGKRR